MKKGKCLTLTFGHSPIPGPSRGALEAVAPGNHIPEITLEGNRVPKVVFVLCREEETVEWWAKLGTEFGYAGLVEPISVSVQFPSLCRLNVETGSPVLHKEIKPNVTGTSRAPWAVDALLMTAAILDCALIDVPTFHPRASHEFELEAGGCLVVLDDKADIPGLNRIWKIEDGEGGFQDSKLNGGSIRVCVIFEQVRQLIRILEHIKE